MVAIILIENPNLSIIEQLYLLCIYACMCTQSLQSCPTLCNSMDCSPSSSSVHGILQARITKWVIMPSSRGSSQPRNLTCVACISCIAGGFFTTEPPEKPLLCLYYMSKCARLPINNFI